MCDKLKLNFFVAGGMYFMLILFECCAALLYSRSILCVWQCMRYLLLFFSPCFFLCCIGTLVTSTNIYILICYFLNISNLASTDFALPQEKHIGYWEANIAGENTAGYRFFYIY